MLSFDLRSLESSAARVDGQLLDVDPVWETGDARPQGPIHVAGRLSRAGTGKFYFSGRIAGTAGASCRRCLADVVTQVDEEIHLLFVDQASAEAEEPDVYVIDARARELDLRPALREEWLLALPAFPLCAESCAGLCPRCGANRNEVACSCQTAPDPRWGALSQLREQL
jgi:uncharacterized protein